MQCYGDAQCLDAVSNFSKLAKDSVDSLKKISENIFSTALIKRSRAILSPFWTVYTICEKCFFRGNFDIVFF